MNATDWMGLAEGQMRWLEAHRHPVLDVIFLGLTSLGSEGFLLLFVGLGYWLVHRSVFARAALMLVLAGLLNTYLKGLFLEPRPTVSHVHPTGGWSFPSGHAQVAAALWGWLAYEIRARRLAASGLWVVALLVAASRPYLGVHYPHDVIAGFLLGCVQVALFAILLRSRIRLTLRSRMIGLGLAAGLLAVLLALLHPSVRDLGVRLAGALVGLALGLSGSPHPGFSFPPQTLKGRILTALIGIAGLLIIWVGFKMALIQAGFGDAQLGAFFRYVLLGAWMIVGAPALSERLGLR